MWIVQGIRIPEEIKRYIRPFSVKGFVSFLDAKILVFKVFFACPRVDYEFIERHQCGVFHNKRLIACLWDIQANNQVNHASRHRIDGNDAILDIALAIGVWYCFLELLERREKTIDVKRCHIVHETLEKYSCLLFVDEFRIAFHGQRGRFAILACAYCYPYLLLRSIDFR